MAGAVGGEIGDEERAAAERALQAGEQSAAGVGVHRDLVVHPGHRVGLAVDRLAGREIDRDRLHDVPEISYRMRFPIAPAESGEGHYAEFRSAVDVALGRGVGFQPEFAAVAAAASNETTIAIAPF